MESSNQPPVFDATPDKMVQPGDDLVPGVIVLEADPGPAVETPVDLQPKKPAKPTAPKPAAIAVALELSIDPIDCPPGYVQRDLDRADLPLTAAVTLKMITFSLIARSETLLDGTRIQRPQQAVTWLLEQISIELPQRVLDAQLSEAARHG
jgi:hypothetical protein